ncbi:MAG: hypothetical protein Tsb0034_30350 [Ekhidna sp.]
MAFSCVTEAQIIEEDFSDGDFKDGVPLTWVASQYSSGDDFVIESEEVRSNGPGVASILTFTTDLGLDFSENNVTWEFSVRYTGGAPSSDNFVEVYLMSSLEELDFGPSGYYIRMGEAGAGDGIDLYRSIAGVPTRIIEDANDLVASSLNVRIRVTRNIEGLWTLAADNTGGTSFSNIGTVTDTEFSAGNYFGLLVRHSSSRNQSYYFDDVVITAAPSTDEIPPQIQSVEVISETEIDVRFSEYVIPATAGQPSNYSISDGISVFSAEIDALDPSIVHLNTSELTNGERYILTVNNVVDESGNVIEANSQAEFEYLVFQEAVEFDVVINEFMADPNPVQTDLPDAEYVEIHNRSSKFFNLENWTLDGQPLEAFTLRPGAFVIIVDDNDAADFAPFTDVLEVSSLSLGNAEDQIILQNDDALTIHSISYEGSTGGISSELINPDGPDYSSQNYGLCMDPDGGTPGEQNSIFDDTPDTSPPAIASISVTSQTELTVQFDEPVEEISAETLSNYSIDGGITVVSATRDDADFTLVYLVTSSLQSGTSRTLTINGVADFSGNVTNDLAVVFEYIETTEAVEGDVVINEFLPTPSETSGLPNSEFIELYNRSDKFIDLQGWTVADQSGSSSPMTTFILRPGGYVILTKTADVGLFDGYGNTLGVAGFPSLNNAGDEISVQNASGTIISKISYNGSVEGVSMELINPENPCISSLSYANSESQEGGTPGAQNSVFDDTPDTVPPSVTSFGFSTFLTINFSEVMDAESLTSGNYSIEGLSVQSVEAVGDLPTSIRITFAEEVGLGQQYELTLSNLADCSGNMIEPTSIVFAFGRKPAFNEILITEIMYDEEPAVGLPEREYLELYNASDEVLSTAGVQLFDATSSVYLPHFNMLPKSFYVLTSPAGTTEFQANAVGVTGLPSLNNSGEQLLLVHNDELIFSLTYDPDWQDSDKREGGYSLELIDLTNPCEESSANWTSSQDANGGTPGAANSTSESIPDSFGPEIVDVVAALPDSIVITMNEKVDPEIKGVEVTINPSVSIDKVHFNVKHPKTVSVKLGESLPENMTNTISLSNLFDCAGNEVSSSEFTFALPVPAQEEEVKLSEVLFNPRPNGVDFVEIYNDSENYISLKGWSLARITDGGISDIKTISERELVIDPEEYLVLTTDAGALAANYPKGISSQFVEMASLPAYSNDTGNVVLLNAAGIVQEQFFYSDDFHYDLLESTDGVSLERLSFSVEATDPNNWRSASSIEGFATPGYKNSQRVEDISTIGKVSVEPKVFIPGNSGSGRDFTRINYQFDTAGKFANVNIYDQSGRLIRNLAQGESLSTSGFFRWDGVTNSGGMARLGYYVVVFELYDASGNAETLKETVVVGRDF